MSRSLRLEFPGSIWHVTSRGNEQRDIVYGDGDRTFLLELLAEAVDRFKWILYAYVLMTNHYHFVIELTQETLSSGMQWFNGSYAGAFNRRHKRVGHLFQGPFDSRIVQKEGYLIQVIRYDALNPVRAKMVSRPEDYPWSSYRATAGLCDSPSWLSVDRVLDCFAPIPSIGRAYYKRFVDEGIGLNRCPWDELVGQLYLGSESWIESMRSKVESKPRSDEFPMRQKNPLPPTMASVIEAVASTLSVSENMIRYGRGGRARRLAAWLACHQGQLGLRAIAAALRIQSKSHASRLIGACKDELERDAGLRETADRCIAILRRV
jgi:putative transposase